MILEATWDKPIDGREILADLEGMVRWVLTQGAEEHNKLMWEYRADVRREMGLHVS